MPTQTGNVRVISTQKALHYLVSRAICIFPYTQFNVRLFPNFVNSKMYNFSQRVAIYIIYNIIGIAMVGLEMYKLKFHFSLSHAIQFHFYQHLRGKNAEQNVRKKSAKSCKTHDRNTCNMDFQCFAILISFTKWHLHE